MPGFIFYTMRKSTFILFLLLIPVLAKAQGLLSFEKTKHNFKFMHQGDTVSHSFSFKNTGDKPVTIKEAKFECACTSVIYPDEPVMPGETASILVKFDSKDAIDRQEREVLILSDAKNAEVILVFKAIVLKKKK